MYVFLYYVGISENYFGEEMSRECCAAFIVRKILGDVLGEFNGRLAAQKLIYLAEKLFGIDLGYNFMWYSRGPYSRALAKDLRICSQTEPCIDKERLEMMRKMLKKIEESGLSLFKGLEIAASYLMLRNEVFPRPKDPVEELIKRKPFIKREEVSLVVSIIDDFIKERKIPT
jgi:uncharacterized protein YwgA